MPFYRSPDGKIIEAKERWDETREGVDVNREKLTAKGFSPLVKFYAPDNKKAVLVNQTSTNIDKLTKKGWQLEVEKQARETAKKGAEATRLQSGTVTKEEIEAIAKANNVPFEFLDELVETVGAEPEYRQKNRIKASIAAVGRSLGGNIPQFIYRELQEPERQKAMSDLQRLADQRKSTLQAGAEMAGSLATPGGGLVKVGTKLGPIAGTAIGAVTGAGVGAAQTVAGSYEGEEAEYALYGALFGGVLGGIPGLMKAGKPDPEAVAALSKEVKAANQGKDIERIIQESRVKNADIIEARRTIFTEGPVSKESLQKLGGEVAKVKRVRKNFEKQKINVDDPAVLQELGSIDMDYRTLRLAEELGWEGKGAKLTRMVSNKEKFASRVSKAKNFIAERKQAPGGLVEVEQAFNRMTDKSIARQAAMTVFRNDKQERFVELKQFLEAPVDGKYVVRGIDRRLGTNAERVILDMDNATNKLSFILAEAQGEIKAIEKAAKETKLDVTDFRKYIENPAEFKTLSPEQKKVVTQAKDFFKKHRDVMVNEFKFKIGDKGDTYFPHRTPSMLETIRRVKGRAEQIKQATEIDLLALRGPDGKYVNLSEEAFQAVKATDPDLVKALEIMGRTKIQNAEGFTREFFAAITPGVGKKPMQATEASAAFMREDAMPDFMLNNDLINGGLGWVQETYRHVLIKDSLAELQRIRDIAIELKDKRAVDYLNGLLDDMTGLRAGTLASETTKFKLAFRAMMDDRLEKATTKVGRGTITFLRDAPEAFSTMLATAYPNFLGLSPRAMLMNLTQIFTMTLPEVGYAAGSKYATQAFGDLSKTMAKGTQITVKNGYVAQLLGANVGDVVTTRKIDVVLANEGHVAKQFTQELADALRGDMRLNVGIENYKKVTNAYSAVAMGLFSGTETINRYLVAQMGQHVAKDLLIGEAKIVQWLRKTPISNQRRMLKMIEAGDEAALTKEVQDYLLSKTILNYTRQSMSNFGRYMGPMFSMFTKWPSTVYGEVIEQYASKGFTAASKDIGMKYMMPLIILSAIDMSIEEDGKVEDPLLRTLVGNRGVTGWAPVTSLEAIAGGEFLKSPASDVIGQAGKIVFDPLNPDQWKKATAELVMTFFPGMSFLRFFENELSTWATGEGPEKSFNPLDSAERLIEGD